MSPDLSEAVEDQAAALVTTARTIETYREARGLSVSRLVREFSGIGSDKTYGKLLKGDTSELNVPVQLGKYRGVLRKIETMREQASKEPLLLGLPNMEEVRLAVAELHQNTGHDRLVIIEGPTSSGKTTALKVLSQQYGDVSIVEASESWRSLSAALADIALAIGAVRERSDLGSSNAEKFDRIIAKLGSSRAIIAIDEAHHMTAQCLNALKTLINRTRAMFVIAGIDTLWKKLQANSWAEARQLVHNRMHCRVILQPPTSQDAADYVQARLGLQISPKLAKDMADRALLHGYMAFVRRCCTIAATAEKQPTEDSLAAAVSQAVTDINGRK